MTKTSRSTTTMDTTRHLPTSPDAGEPEAEPSGHPTERADATGNDGPSPSLPQRAVEAISQRLSRPTMRRRSFLTRVALIGAALAVDPIGFVFKPRTAWASVCGDDPEFEDGWSAFCATINDGANTCPSGSYPAGWWKIDNTTFCGGAARYIVDCNRSPSASCNCHAADGECDHRRVCCNNFRYGQCNTQIRGTTEVVCRIVLCTPPWEWGNCNRTSLTSNQTRTHWSARLPSRTNPTPIMVRWLDLGLNGSVLGELFTNERSVGGGGRYAKFENGALTQRPSRNTTTMVVGAHGRRYRRIDGPAGALGFPADEVVGNPSESDYDHGHIYRSGDDAVPVWGDVNRHYRHEGAHGGWMGQPRTFLQDRGKHKTMRTASGWWVVRSGPLDRARALRSIDDLPADGTFPPTVTVHRWRAHAGFARAADTARRAYEQPDTVLVVRGNYYPHTMAVGAVTARLDAPILLTFRNRLANATVDALEMLGPSRAVVVGGHGMIDQRVDRQLEDMGLEVERWGGNGRFAVATRVARECFPSGADKVVLVYGTDWPSAFSVAPLAHHERAPVLLSKRSSLTSATVDAINHLGPRTVVFASSRANLTDGLRNEVESQFGVSTTRLAGTTPYTAARQHARLVAPHSDRVILTSSRDYTAALAATSFAVPRRLPILYADDRIRPPTDNAILEARPGSIVLLGNHEVVGVDAYRQAIGYVR